MTRAAGNLSYAKVHPAFRGLVKLIVCEIVPNCDPTPEVLQRIDLVCKHANSAGSSFARNVTPPRKRIHTRDQWVASTLGGVTVGLWLTLGAVLLRISSWCRAAAGSQSADHDFDLHGTSVRWQIRQGPLIPTMDLC